MLYYNKLPKLLEAVSPLTEIERCPSVGPALWTLNRHQPSAFPDPKNLDGGTLTWPEQQKVIGLFDRYLIRLDQATLHTQNGYIQLNNSVFADDTYWIKSQGPDSSVPRNRINRLAVYRRGNWLSLLLYWGTGYYHWFCDILSKLHLVLPNLPADTRFILPKNPAPWMLKSLLLMGICQKRLVTFDSKLPWRLEHLYHASPVGMTGDIDASAVNLMREAILQNAKIPNCGKQRLFLSRAKARCRNIANESELANALNELGFKCVHLEDQSLEEQIILFSNAEIVIAPHGAGLTNLLWSKPSTTVLEIFEPSVFRRCYWSLCHSLKMNHLAIVGETCRTGKIEPDILVDTAPILQFIRSRT